MIITNLIQLIYASHPFGYDDASLVGILSDARRCNQRDNITGALICRHDIYLQLLEGPQNVVEAAYARILRDDRHANIRQLSCQPVEDRIFGKWAMLHDPVATWIWSQEDVASGVLDRASPDDIVAAFRNVAATADA